VRPLRISTQSSMKRNIIGSRELSGVDLKRFKEKVSVSNCKAACDCPTETSPSAWRNTVSGLENGAMIPEVQEIFKKKLSPMANALTGFGRCAGRAGR